MVCLPGEPGRVLPAQIFPPYSVSLEMWPWRYSRLFVLVNCLVSDTCLRSSLVFGWGRGPSTRLFPHAVLIRCHLLVWTPPNQLLWSQPVVSLVHKEALGNIAPPSRSCGFHSSLPSTPNVPGMTGTSGAQFLFNNIIDNIMVIIPTYNVYYLHNTYVAEFYKII